MRLSELTRLGIVSPSQFARDNPIARSMVIVEDELTPVDPSAMTASAVINTDAVDYTNSIIMPSGVRLGNYQLNPVVLYEHGRSGINHPIATAESPEGDLMIDRQENEIYGTAYFAETAKSFPIVYQYFGLIESRVLRATSIQVVPTSKAVYQDEQGHKYDVTEEGEMVEFSWCTLPVNPEAVRRSMVAGDSDRLLRAWELQVDRAADLLGKGTVGNERFLEPIRRCLEAIVPPAAPRGVGADFTTEKEMSLRTITKPEAKKLGAARLKKIVCSNEIDQYDAYSRPILRSLFAEVVEEESPGEEGVIAEAKAADANEDAVGGIGQLEEGATYAEAEAKADEDLVDPATAEEAVIEEPVAEVSEAAPAGDKPAGALAAGEIHDGVLFMVDQFDQLLTPIENQVIKEGMPEILQALRDIAVEVEGLYSSAYPELPALSGGEVADEAPESELKSLLATNARLGFRSRGLRGQLTRIASLPGVSEPVRRSIMAVGDQFGRIESAARSYRPPAPKGMVSKAEFDRVCGERDKAEQLCDRLIKKVESEMLPSS